MTITFSETNKLWKLHQGYCNKFWWRNMNNIIINYRHKGEETHIRFIHMNKKCRIDKVGIHPYSGIW